MHGGVPRDCRRRWMGRDRAARPRRTGLPGWALRPSSARSERPRSPWASVGSASAGRSASCGSSAALAGAFSSELHGSRKPVRDSVAAITFDPLRVESLVPISGRGRIVWAGGGAVECASGTNRRTRWYRRAGRCRASPRLRCERAPRHRCRRSPSRAGSVDREAPDPAARRRAPCTMPPWRASTSSEVPRPGWSPTGSGGVSTTCGSRSPTGATSAAPTACPRRSTAGTSRSCRGTRS